MIAANWAPMLVREDATPAPADYNGDGKADLAARVNTGPLKGRLLIDYYKQPGNWYQKQGWPFRSSTAIYGGAGDRVVPADYDGDGKADIAVFFLAGKTLKIDFAKNGFKKWDAVYTYSSLKNAKGDILPVGTDFDGDNKADICFKLADGRWLLDFSKNKFGSIDDIKTGYGDHKGVAVPADYDGDGKADISVKNNDGLWQIDLSTNGLDGWDVQVSGCGNDTEIPVPGDYNGDGKADISVKTAKGSWKIAYAFENNSPISWLPQTLSTPYGGAEAIPLPADYNGDGKTDLGFVINSDGRWLIDDFAAVTNGYDWHSTVGKAANDFDSSHLNPRDVAAYTKLKKASFNLVTDAPFSMLTYDVQKNYFLELINKVGVKMMISDPHIYSYEDTMASAGFDKNDFVKKYKTQLPKGYRKWLYAINLGDEPGLLAKRGKTTIEPLARVQQWTAFFERNYPALPTFNNLLPLYGFASIKAYTAYLEQYRQSSNSPFICFDHYPFRKSGMLLPSYFQNLSLVRSLFSDRSLWSTAWSAFDKTGDIIKANEILTRFMVFCPVIYGAKGIAYFPYDASYNVRDFSSGINTDTALYNTVKNINLFLKNIVAPVTVNYRHTATLHKGTALGYRPTNTREMFSAYQGIIKDVSNENMAAGVFEQSTTLPVSNTVKDCYLWIMNKDTAGIKKAVVTLRGNRCGRISVSPRVINYIKTRSLIYKAVTGATYNKADDTTSFVLEELAACEGVMVRVRL